MHIDFHWIANETDFEFKSSDFFLFYKDGYLFQGILLYNTNPQITLKNDRVIFTEYLDDIIT
ncbi:hypothetical protein CWI38_0013p0030 [Hamiltosporidium tvaerminnensis]|uniref:Uncharacterized protein n=1 Tax=Hamiltosporidium tvaerminnensis TaxID=1176355 RepID=A0A4Q9M545_9MICR|nr:hypothetical protein CWI38_0013p0030 [Hamiltosporidium tvaerminnensis]